MQPTTVNLSKWDLEYIFYISLEHLENRIANLEYRIKKYSECPTKESFRASKKYSTWYDWEAESVESDKASLELYKLNVEKIKQARKDLGVE